MTSDDSPDRVLVLNPASGSGDHADRVEAQAAEAGFTVRRTAESGDAVRLARDAAGADTVAACGGDGTVNGVVTGLDAAGALEDTAVGVVPAGTGNNFAENIGIEGIDHAFDVLADGERRRIDLGAVVDGAEPPDGEGTRPLFVNSFVGGLTADASRDTSTAAKSRLGVLAYVVETLRTASEFDGLPLSLATADGERWEGEALLLLVGNARRFPGRGGTQADVEDGAFEVVVVEERPTVDLAGDTAVAELFGREAQHLRRFTAPELTVAVREGESTFSLDGEMLTADRLSLRTEPGVLTVAVGEAYEPSPD